MTTTQTAEQFVSTITGGERDLITRRYKHTLNSLQSSGDKILQLEVLTFLDLARSGGRPDEAYNQAHGMSIAELNDYFAEEPEEPVDDEARRAEANELARFCLATGRSAAEYAQLDEVQRTAFIEQAIALGLVTVKEA